MAPDPRPVHTPTPDPVRPDVKITSVAPIAAENAGEPVKAAAAARDDDAENAKPEGIVKARPARRFKPAMGLGASGIAVIIRPKNQRSEHSERRAARAEKVSERTPAKSPAKFAAVDNDDQRGIPGQAWEPLISSCAKVKRDCNGATFCGC
jgi:hypothetical protein